MKKIIASLFIFILMFTMYCNINISYGEDINLESYFFGGNTAIFDSNGYLNETYYHDYETGGKYGYGQYDFCNDSGVNLAVNYTWLHKFHQLVTKINSDNVSYQDIADSNSEEDILNAIHSTNDLKDIIGTFQQTGQYVTEPDNSTNWNDLLDTFRSVAALRNITGETGKAPKPAEEYQKKVRKVIKELQSALDYKRGNSNQVKASDGRKVDINDDYKTKFKYTKSQIKAYKERYGERYNCNNDSNIKKLWTYKLGLDDNDSIATRSDIYVDKSDNASTKKGYDSDQLKVYKLLFGTDSNVKNADLGDIDSIIEKGKAQNAEITEESLSKFSTAEYEYGYQEAQKAIDEGTKSRNDPDKDTIFLMPNGTADAEKGIKDFADDAAEFLDSEGNMEIVNQENLQNFSQNIYSMLLGVGIIVAVLVGVILGVKLMLAPIGERAEAKKLLIPYAVGCAVVFGAFGIWKLVITILSGI